MNKIEEINEILGVKESYQAPAKMMQLLYDKNERENAYFKFMDLFENDVTYEWFQSYFEDEHADRKKQKQDFTPKSIGDLVSKLTQSVNDAHTFYDCCAGTGALTIGKWWNDCVTCKSMAEYKPSQYLYFCEEMSDRAIPFLLFNLCLRGINAIVIQCDVLTREAYGAFFIQNTDDDFMKFSDFNVFPYTKDVEKYFNIKFVEEKYKLHVESKNIWNGEDRR